MAKHLLVALLLLVVNLFQASQCAVAQKRGRKIAYKQSKEFSCTGCDGSYPSPGECTDVYYVCSGGMASTQVCPAGNIFDPVIFVCTPFDQASCNQKFNCPVDGVFPYPDACTNLYYICSTGQSFIQYCPPEFVFDPISLRCETKETASCTTCGNYSPTNSFTCPDSNGTYPYDSCSSLYWQCSNDDTKLIHILQPENQIKLEWNSCHQDGFFSTDIGNPCSSDYVSCVSGIAYHRVCPRYDLFDPTSRICKKAYLVSC